MPRYVAHITRGDDNVATEIFEAKADEDAYAQAKAWASSLDLASDDNVWMQVKDPNGAFKPFSRADF